MRVLLGLIRQSFHDSDRTYGARRVWRDVLAEGLSCGLHRIERLMHKHALKARPRRRKLPPDTGLRVINAILRQTFSTDSSTPHNPTANGLLTSLTSGPLRAGFMWLPSLISFQGASSVSSR